MEERRPKRVFLVLSSTGRVGQRGARFLAKKEIVTKVIVSARNENRLKEVARQVGDKAEAVRLDVLDYEALLELMKKADLVINYAGPGAKVAPVVAKAALKSKIHLVDVQDDAEAVPSLQCASIDATKGHF